MGTSEQGATEPEEILRVLLALDPHLRRERYRFAFGLTRATFEAHLGPVPSRPPKGSVVDVPGSDPTRLDALVPHPVYAWMAWVQILSPSAASFDALRPLLAESLERARATWRGTLAAPRAA